MKYSTGLLAAFQRVGAARDAGSGENVVDVDQLAWMAGDWRCIDGDEFVQESWLKPVKDSMSGMFRKISNEQLVMHEYRFLAKEGGHIMLRCQRYSGDEPAKRGAEPGSAILRLVEMRPAYAAFENTGPASETPQRISYQRDDNRLIVTAASGKSACGNARKSEFRLAAR